MQSAAVASKALRPTSMKPPRSLPHRSAVLPPTEWVPNQKKLEVKLPENSLTLDRAVSICGHTEQSQGRPR